MARIGLIEDFLHDRKEYKAKGLTEAFKQQLFGDFPIHDLVECISRKRYKSFAKKYRNKTNFLRCLRIRNVFLLYLSLLLGNLIIIAFFIVV